MNSLFSSGRSLAATLASIALISVVSVAATTAQADISEASVQRYASHMKQAANSQNVSKISSLVADEALISLSRRGKTTSLDKSAYIKLLQDSWSNSNNYSYDINISNIVVSGNQAKADVKTVETWEKDGQPRTITTTSRATLKSDSNNAVLLRAVAQVSIE